MLSIPKNQAPSELDEPSKMIGAKIVRTGGQLLRVPQGLRVGKPDKPSDTITAQPSRVGAGSAHVLEWPWDRPSTTITTRGAIPPPGHHPEEGSILSVPNAVVLSEEARALLQGFPEGWKFCGRTKKTRSAQIGQAMPPGLAEAVARAVVAALEAAARCTVLEARR
jgi:site-specific DNA-cytosine methylase